MDRNTKVVLTQAWWDTNRASTLNDKGNLGRALKNFEPLLKLVALTKGAEKIRQLNAADDACDALRKAAAATAGACVKGVHDDTQWVLKNSFLKAVEAVEKELKKARDKFEDDVNALTLDEVYADKTMRVLLAQCSRKEQTVESLEFLILAGWGNKRTNEVYDAYVPAKAPKELNLGSDLRKRMVAAHAKDGVTKALWDEAVEVIQRLLSNETLKRLKEDLRKGNL